MITRCEFSARKALFQPESFARRTPAKAGERTTKAKLQ